MTPRKSNGCAVLIPTQKNAFSEVDTYCLARTTSVLSNWDVWFVVPDGLDIGPLERFDAQFARFDARHFTSVAAHSRWLLRPQLYDAFSRYEKILICQPDATVLRDDLAAWVDRPVDYVGAPWFDRVHVQPELDCRPELGRDMTVLDVGNGGLSLRNPRKCAEMTRRHRDLVEEIEARYGDALPEDVVFSLIARIDPAFRVASREDAVSFALEGRARWAILKYGVFPMGFHKLYAIDPPLWMLAFPDSPHVELSEAQAELIRRAARGVVREADGVDWAWGAGNEAEGDGVRRLRSLLVSDGTA